METKFTPAPWVVVNSHEEITISNYNHTTKDICSVHTDDIDANLIAMAPELYNMLNDLLKAEGVIFDSHNRRSIKVLEAKQVTDNN